ncbi:hypothetical protein TL16_g11740 [Triparma laevis f. inornata]|uniref:DUF7802 domain-containing protein n=1 Tax=Triparma laevis f. inornata TaxID=1714386 RepID=A0A9W7ETR7_9STRA|nr:hypothetical protein TL16_g11740 [Triparma laevis f. inornata]
MSSSYEWYPDKPYPDFTHLKPLQTQLSTQPSILTAEILFTFSSLLCLIHALLTSRSHVITWFSAIISGTANDIFFMILPMVDNFWHAQCTVMLTPRLPLYIPLAYARYGSVYAIRNGESGRGCKATYDKKIIYVSLHTCKLPRKIRRGPQAGPSPSPNPLMKYALKAQTVMFLPFRSARAPARGLTFQYVGVAASQRLQNASTLSKSAYAGLCSSIFYAAYDLVGAKFLWWSWHTTDAATVIRWCGVPVGSTMWTLVHVFVFTYILNCTVFNPAAASSSFTTSFIKGGAATAILTTPCMMIMMSPFQLHQLEIDFSSLTLTQLPGKPDITAISLVVATFGYLANKGLRTGVAPPRWPDKMLFATVLLHFATLTLVLAMFDPEAVTATGLHQTIGDCDTKDYDLSGYERRKYLCNKKKHSTFSNHNQYFSVCGKVKDVDWFTICGKGKVERRHLEGIAVLTLIGICLFRILVVSRKRTKKD